MKQVCFERMSDREVVERLEELLREERRLTAAVLAHLGEVEARRLYLPAACSSMHVYCVRVLEENVGELVAEASGKSKGEIEIVLARRAPRADGPDRLERMAEQVAVVAREPAGEAAPEPVGERVAPEPAGRRAAVVAPLSPEKVALQVTIGEATRSKLLRSQALLRHQVPSGERGRAGAGGMCRARRGERR